MGDISADIVDIWTVSGTSLRKHHGFPFLVTIIIITRSFVKYYKLVSQMPIIHLNKEVSLKRIRKLNLRVRMRRKLL